MTHIRCPKCHSSIQVADYEAGKVVSCSECGGKFCLRPRAAVQTAARPRATKPVEEPEEEDEIDEGPATPPPARKIKRKPDDDREDDGEPVTPVRKKRKKKKKDKKQREINPVHIILAVVGLLVVAGASTLFYLIQHGAFSEPPPDPNEVLAELQKIGGFVQRDENRPGRPVVAVTIDAERFNASVLNKLVAFPELRSLNLSRTLSTDLTLEHLRNLTTLKYLNVSRTKVAGGLDSLKGLVNLEELDLDQTLVTDGALEELKGLTKLKKIHLDGTLASGLGLQAAIPGLEIIK